MFTRSIKYSPLHYCSFLKREHSITHMNLGRVDRNAACTRTSIISLYTLNSHTYITWKCTLAPCWHACKVAAAGKGLWDIQYLLVLSTVFQRDSVARHWIFICMVQAITGHSSALAGRSISYYSMKLTFSLQTSVPLPQRGRPSLCFEKKRIGGGRGNEGWRELKRERERTAKRGKPLGQ